MKNLVVLLISLFLIQVASGQELRKVQQNTFKRGEILQYKASYGIIDAARATLSVVEEDKILSGRNTFHVVGVGKTLGAFDWFFKVDDRYESYIDEKALVPWVFLRRVHEGGFELRRNIYFNQYKKELKVKNLKNNEVQEFKAESHVQDLLSCFYYARTLNLQAAKEGEVFTIMTFFDYEHYPMKIKFLGREKIKTSLGTFNCLKFSPMLQEGRVFKESEDMVIWLSDDQNKVPIRLQTNLLIGSLKMDLESYSGIMAPLNQVVKKK